jgi:ubiquinone/menaquinone biosynthesis C-methylase UbiE
MLKREYRSVQKVTDKKSDINSYQFEENTSTLTARIEAHRKYAKLEINDWILEIINLQSEEKVLDIGCGTGKQIIPYKKRVGEKGRAVGTDISEELIEDARKIAQEAGLEIEFLVHDANNSFNFPDNTFDAISCCFAIYYLRDIEKALLELKRMLKPGGRIFLAGPTPENAKLLHTLHKKVTKKPLPYMPGVSRFMNEILSMVKKHFQKIKVDRLQNPMHFQDVDSFLDYYISTGLFINSSNDDKEKGRYKEDIKKEVQKIIQKKGYVEIMKEIGGILGFKSQ